MMPRGKPEMLIAGLLLLVLASYVWYIHDVVSDLRSEARRSSDMYAHVYHAFADTTPGAETKALIDLSAAIRDQGVPVILTDLNGRVSGHANLPFEHGQPVPDDDARVREYVPVLAALHPPIVDSLIGKVYYGDPPIV